MPDPSRAGWRGPCFVDLVTRHSKNSAGGVPRASPALFGRNVTIRTGPDPVDAALDAWLAGEGIKSARDRIEAAIEAYEAANFVLARCDEPGCGRESSCGWPSSRGYRRTCFEHWEREK